jgi:glutamine synthetase
MSNDNSVVLPVSEYFGELTFGLRQMREKLPKDAFSNLMRTLEKGDKLTKETAEVISQVIKDWAVVKGATHFCHWFQPMTGLTAEKHDAFITIQHSHHSELRVIERFSGSQLIQGEPDASSFPSGGMRSTFEARGYTAWDPTSPIFIVTGEKGHTLCIPSVFFGYHGHALDNKTPLLRSMTSVSKEATEFLKLLGDVDCKSIQTTLGVEQEYFLIERDFAFGRPDIIMSGRTLLGAAAPRGQQLEDHYFGSIPSRVKSFMEDAEMELFKLGVPVKTRHNEVAPSQYEIAPIFESANIAADHNALTMETLKRVAIRHGLLCMFHEKPFKGLNGSGKHCNWSLSNDKGENLLEPGTTPHQNLRFLAVCAIVLKAVHDHADVLRAAIASPGNDHRLGGNEAPPAIMSAFMGSFLEKIFDSIEQGNAAEATDSSIIDLGVNHLPKISKDYTDRNRTSPFAFTGNKFEFRAVGSSANVSVPISILNAAVTESFKNAAHRLKELLGQKIPRDEAVMQLTRMLLKEARNIRFEGNNYSSEWKEEAKRRGLPILENSYSALSVLKSHKAVQFLIDTKVLTDEEIHARYHILVERHVKTLLIEINTLTELTRSHVIPALEAQILETAQVASQFSSSVAKKAHGARMAEMEDAYGAIITNLGEVEKIYADIDGFEDVEKQMQWIVEKSTPLVNKLRDACDKAETIIGSDLWKLPKYREMLFTNTLS